MNLSEQELAIGAQRIAYIHSEPSDQTIVFIHGNSSCKDAFQDQYGALIEAGYGIAAVDLPGHGKSSDAPIPENDYTIPAYAELIQTVLGELNVTRPLLCGWSLGGHIAIQMIGNGFDHAGLMICGTPPIGLNAEDAAAAFLPSEFSAVTGEESPSKERLAGYVAAVYGTKSPVPDAFMQAGFRTDGKSRSNMVANWQSGANLHDQRAIVETGDKPLLIVHGSDDAFVAQSYFNSLALPQAPAASEFRVFDNIGHAPFLEAPERFNRILLEFCEQCFEG